MTVVYPAGVEGLPLAQLVPYAHNARTHSPEQVDKIAASMLEFGFTQPVLIDDAKGIIAGHGRVLAARALGLIDVPVIRLSHLTPEQRRAYVLADNQLATLSGWDNAMLAQELATLSLADYDLDVLGFPTGQIEALLEGLTAELENTGSTLDGAALGQQPRAGADVGNPAEGNAGTGFSVVEDDAPEPPQTPVSQLGDIWVLGEHRLCCGDSTDPEAVARLLAGAKPHLMVTDPPYGVEYDADWRNQALRADGSTSEGRAIGPVQNDDRADWRDAWALFPGEVAYVWHGMRRSGEVFGSLCASGFGVRAEIVWAKSALVISRGHYHAQHESCWYAVRDKGTAHWTGGTAQSTVWPIDKPRRSETVHSTQKPVECMLRPMLNNSEPGDAVYEPFSGSGTTIIAGEQAGRRVYAMEIDPAYVDVAVRRWEALTGLEAQHADGRPFAAVEIDRLG